MRRTGGRCCQVGKHLCWVGGCDDDVVCARAKKDVDAEDGCTLWVGGGRSKQADRVMCPGRWAGRWAGRGGEGAAAGEEERARAATAGVGSTAKRRQDGFWVFKLGSALCPDAAFWARNGHDGRGTACSGGAVVRSGCVCVLKKTRWGDGQQHTMQLLESASLCVCCVCGVVGWAGWGDGVGASERERVRVLRKTTAAGTQSERERETVETNPGQRARQKGQV